MRKSTFTVRPAVRQEISRELANTPFGKDLFSIKLQHGEYLISVVFTPKPNFFFCLKELPEIVNARFYFETIEAPGLWKLEKEEFQHEGFAQARGRLAQWAGRIQSDYVAQKNDFEGLERLREHIFAEFEKTDIPEGERFTPEEKQAQERKVEELEQKIEALYREKTPIRIKLT